MLPAPFCSCPLGRVAVVAAHSGRKREVLPLRWAGIRGRRRCLLRSLWWRWQPLVGVGARPRNPKPDRHHREDEHERPLEGEAPREFRRDCFDFRRDATHAGSPCGPRSGRKARLSARTTTEADAGLKPTMRGSCEILSASVETRQ